MNDSKPRQSDGEEFEGKQPVEGNGLLYRFFITLVMMPILAAILVVTNGGVPG